MTYSNKKQANLIELIKFRSLFAAFPKTLRENVAIKVDDTDVSETLSSYNMYAPTAELHAPDSITYIVKNNSVVRQPKPRKLTTVIKELTQDFKSNVNIFKGGLSDFLYEQAGSPSFLKSSITPSEAQALFLIPTRIKRDASYTEIDHSSKINLLPLLQQIVNNGYHVLYNTYEYYTELSSADPLTALSKKPTTKQCTCWFAFKAHSDKGHLQYADDSYTTMSLTYTSFVFNPYLYFEYLDPYVYMEPTPDSDNDSQESTPESPEQTGDRDDSV